MTSSFVLTWFILLILGCAGWTVFVGGLLGWQAETTKWKLFALLSGKNLSLVFSDVPLVGRFQIQPLADK